MNLFGSIEAGGTKIVCAVGDDGMKIVEKINFPTTTPQKTTKKIIEFFKKYENDLVSIGIGSFGPIDINEYSETFGYITNTPKEGWKNFNFLGSLKSNFDILFYWTTDVNAAAFGEYTAGSAISKNSLVYYTVGTGVGGSSIQNGRFSEGFSHPEMGHMFVKKINGDNFAGICPFHGDCIEGLISGPAIESRTGIKGENLKDNDPVWDIVAEYIAQCIYNTAVMYLPAIIILGGGVMHQEFLIKKIRIKFSEKLNGYLDIPPIDEYIVAPTLEDNAGTIGCIALAIQNYNNSKSV